MLLTHHTWKVSETLGYYHPPRVEENKKILCSLLKPNCCNEGSRANPRSSRAQFRQLIQGPVLLSTHRLLNLRDGGELHCIKDRNNLFTISSI